MVSLRDPVERAWSSYLYARKHGSWPDTFAEALRTRPELLEHGRYATGLDRFLQRLPREMVHVALFDDLTADPQRFLDGVTDFLGIDPLPLTDKELEARLPAARARSVHLASAARRSADWIREHDGATLVGRVKRSPLVQRALYRPIDREALRPAPDDVITVRTALAPEIDSLEPPWDFACARPGAGSADLSLVDAESVDPSLVDAASTCRLLTRSSVDPSMFHRPGLSTH